MSALIPSPTIIAHLALIFVVFNMLVMSAAFMVWLERKVCAWIQDRHGPNRVGFEGLLQPFADVFKLMMKEDLRPKAADAALFAIAPIISCITAFAAFSVVPFGTETTLFGLLDEPIPLQVTDVNVAVLVIFAIASMGVYGIVLAGWASNSKYSLLGGLRSAAQMISYELSYGMALAAVIMLAGSLSLREIVLNQSGYWFGVIPKWYVFLQPIGFFIFMTAGVAETNRAPFDFPEAEQELVAGYHTEYSSMSFALFFLAEYVNMVTVSAVATSLYLGGWLGPFLPDWLQWIYFLIKVFLILFFYVWMRWTLPRYRYDQLMEFGWKWLLPVSVVNLLATIAFYIFAAIAILASLGVIGQGNPMHSVMLLIVSFGALAGLYILLQAPFTAVTQIIIYAGAIMVLFLFVVMLLNVPREEPVPVTAAGMLGPTAMKTGAVLSVVLAIEVVWGLSRLGPTWFSQDAEAAGVSSVSRIGNVLFTDHAFAFEATSILILVAMVGAVVIARREH
jgi:NADH-quinone oxidoreductase subunit H